MVLGDTPSRGRVNDSLAGRCVVVVGASAGIGRAVAVQAVRSGAHVALVARRQERLAETVVEAGGGIAVPGDVRDPSSCTEAIGRSAEMLQGIDVLCYCAGMAPLAMLADTDGAHWQAVFETNVIGANHAIRASLPYLHPSSLVMTLSSDTVVQPRTGLGAYGASKSALRTAMASWRAEHPDHRFCCVVVGPTAPTEFGDDFDGALLGPLLEDWTRRGLAQEQMLHTDDVAQVIVATMATLLRHPQVGMDEFVLRSPSAVVGTVSSIAASFTAVQRRIDERRGPFPCSVPSTLKGPMTMSDEQHYAGRLFPEPVDLGIAQPDRAVSSVAHGTRSISKARVVRARSGTRAPARPAIRRCRTSRSIRQPVA